MRGFKCFNLQLVLPMHTSKTEEVCGAK